MSDFDAREFTTSNFLKKEDLRKTGPQRLTIRAVERAEGLKSRNGTPAKPALQLVFSDDRRLTLGTQVNLMRCIEFFGERTAPWIGQTVEAYYSPDVRGPGGEVGGIRLRLPEGPAPVPVPVADYATVLAKKDA
jgi:hypothetical protein